MLAARRKSFLIVLIFGVIFTVCKREQTKMMRDLVVVSDERISRVNDAECSCLEKSLTNPEQTLQCKTLDFIFYTFYVDGEHLVDTTYRFTHDSRRHLQKAKKNEIEVSISSMVRNLQKSIKIFHDSACLVVRTNNESLFRDIPGVAVL